MSIVISKPNFKTKEGHTFVDLNLYLSEFERGALRFSSTLKSRDVVVSKDFNAISNSMRNILTSRRGDRPLLPEFGVDLERFLFQPLSENTGREISSTILEAIEKWESRVKVERVSTIINNTNLEYQISLFISVPILDLRNANFFMTFGKDTGLYLDQDVKSPFNTPPKYPFGL